jgi:hypothetical protein
LKKLILLFAFVFSAFVVNAQVGYNYKEFAIGLDVGYERGYTNLNRQDEHFGESVNFTYNYSPYIPITAELQFGTLSGGGLTPNLDKYGRQYMNHFEGLIIHGDFQLGEVVDYTESYFMSAIKGLYFGSGGGIIFNSNTVQRTNVYDGTNGLPNYGPSTYVFPGNNSSINLTIPLRIGYEFKLFNEYEEPWMAIDIGYVHNLVFGEGLDGYDDPSNKFKNNATNQYRQIVVGVKFNFGNVTSYSKVIRQL